MYNRIHLCIYLNLSDLLIKHIDFVIIFQSSKKGVIKKSIFATPENVNGRVGIGTCGVSGREMTKFSNGEKWRRGA